MTCSRMHVCHKPKGSWLIELFPKVFLSVISMFILPAGFYKCIENGTLHLCMQIHATAHMWCHRACSPCACCMNTLLYSDKTAVCITCACPNICAHMQCSCLKETALNHCRCPCTRLYFSRSSGASCSMRYNTMWECDGPTTLYWPAFMSLLVCRVLLVWVMYLTCTCCDLL